MKKANEKEANICAWTQDIKEDIHICHNSKELV